MCSGAMILAEAGVLDGIAATTHWARQEHTRDYPKVDWDLDRISISQGKVFTSAGVTTGIDLALAIIQVDCGPSTALAVARELIVQLRRTGAKASMPSTLPTSSPAMGQWRNSSSRLLPGQIWTGRWKRWPMPCGMNTRTLTRRFKRDLEETAGAIRRKGESGSRPQSLAGRDASKTGRFRKRVWRFAKNAARVSTPFRRSGW